MKLKKIDSNYTYSNILVTTSYSSFTSTQLTSLWKNAQFCADMDNGLIYITDDVREFVGENAWVEIEDHLDARDSSGRKITRGATTIDGWHFQLLSTELTTSKLNGFFCKKEDGTDVSFITYKLYDLNNNEITTQENELNAVKTCVWIRPTHDIEILGGLFSQYSIPSDDIRMWVIGLPGVANVAFTTGGINLRGLGNSIRKVTDGRASKYLQYVPSVPDANSFKITLTHPAGLQHTLQLHLEIFKQP